MSGEPARICGDVSANSRGQHSLDAGRLISDAYRGLNAKLHADTEAYGNNGHKWARVIERCNTPRNREPFSIMGGANAAWKKLY